VWTFDPNRYGIVREYSPYHSGIKVAVVDTGVKRDHEDLEGVFTSWGVDCFNHEYVVGVNYGWYRQSDEYRSHGTAVSGIIGALTNTTGVPPPPPIGVASCASGIKLLPVYVSFEGNSVEKAIRALRFEFQLTGGNPKERYVRVVNMSLCGRENEEIAKYDIGCDIEVEHRFYVAAAGNYRPDLGDDDRYGRYYPAAMDNVMGVTGMDGSVDGDDLAEELWQHVDTHYYNTDAYPASAFYWFSFTPAGGSGTTTHQSLWSAVIPDDTIGYTGYYDWFGGTSAATPQVAALAARLFQEAWFLIPTEENRMLVWNRIVSTTREPRGQIAGIVDYEAALEGWE